MNKTKEKINMYRLCARIAQMIICESPDIGGLVDRPACASVREHFVAMLIDLLEIMADDEDISRDAWHLISAYRAGYRDEELADISRQLLKICHEKIREASI